MEDYVVPQLCGVLPGCIAGGAVGLMAAREYYLRTQSASYKPLMILVLGGAAAGGAAGYFGTQYFIDNIVPQLEDSSFLELVLHSRI